jgi:hypothetical protein
LYTAKNNSTNHRADSNLLDITQSINPMKDTSKKTEAFSLNRVGCMAKTGNNKRSVTADVPMIKACDESKSSLKKRIANAAIKQRPLTKCKRIPTNLSTLSLFSISTSPLCFIFVFISYLYIFKAKLKAQTYSPKCISILLFFKELNYYYF